MTFNRIPAEVVIQGGVADGNYDSPLMDAAFERMYLGYIRFFNAAGAQVTPGAGTVAFTASPDGVNFQNVQNGSFNAIDAYSPTRAIPSAQGPARRARITLAGVTGAVSFIAGVDRY
ncbi:MAG: DUF7265 domain-containing protein [Edwardsiella tarda]